MRLLNFTTKNKLGEAFTTTDLVLKNFEQVGGGNLNGNLNAVIARDSGSNVWVVGNGATVHHHHPSNCKGDENSLTRS